MILTALGARAAEPAWDDASQPDYRGGWEADDNGGSGFAPWQIQLRGGAAGLGSSTANGDAVAPTGDIDSLGARAWTLSSARALGSPLAVRPFLGALTVGQTMSFDIDGICKSSNPDTLSVALGNAGGDRWGMTVHQSGTHASNGHGGSTGIALDTVEGIHVDFTLTGTDSFTASVRVLDGRDAVALGGTLDGTANSAIDRISFLVNPSIAPVDAFYLNNLAVTPEPGAAVAVLAGTMALATGRRRRRGTCLVRG